ncbi:hypothetical protein XENOCAPTIV_015020 [Xenoophorus captivus]|uniref:Uncharacterized protein n=1 Tax=Xenoophorus captivus TaxID=1517983 RepID=A0ABV0QX37_9TELE
MKTWTLFPFRADCLQAYCSSSTLIINTSNPELTLVNSQVTLWHSKTLPTRTQSSTTTGELCSHKTLTNQDNILLIPCRYTELQGNTFNLLSEGNREGNLELQVIHPSLVIHVKKQCCTLVIKQR